MRALLLIFLVACTTSAVGSSTGATCAPSSAAPLTYETFGREFMTKYCTTCHSTSLTGAKRRGAPTDDNFDTLEAVMAAATEIDQIAGVGPKAANTDMPPSECGMCEKPPMQAREQLASWLACERGTAH